MCYTYLHTNPLVNQSVVRALKEVRQRGTAVYFVIFNAALVLRVVTLSRAHKMLHADVCGLLWMKEFKTYRRPHTRSFTCMYTNYVRVRLSPRSGPDGSAPFSKVACARWLLSSRNIFVLTTDSSSGVTPLLESVVRTKIFLEESSQRANVLVEI